MTRIGIAPMTPGFSDRYSKLTELSVLCIALARVELANLVLKTKIIPFNYSFMSINFNCNGGN